MLHTTNMYVRTWYHEHIIIRIMVYHQMAAGAQKRLDDLGTVDMSRHLSVNLDMPGLKLVHKV